MRTVFDGLSRGDYALALDGLTDDVHHVFAGDHCLSGERHSREAVQRWFERLFRLFDLDFEVHAITCSGPAWDTTAVVEWTAQVTPRRGEPYANSGAHVIRLQRGRITYLHAYEDSQAVANACRVMADAGITEAAAPPIVDQV